MKKKRNVMSIYKLDTNEILLKMKLLTLLMFIAFVSASASSYSQATKFNLNLKAVTIGDVFQKIEEKSEFVIIFNEKTLDVNRKVDVEVTDEPVEKILDQIFNGDKDAYRILDSQIAIYPNERKEFPSNSKKESSNEPQKKEISGTVKDPKGIPLLGVSVIVKGTTIGTITNDDGQYRFLVPTDAKMLSFSFIGMKTQEIVLGANKTINVILNEEAIGIEEIVAVGYGTQKKGNLTGSISTVKSQDLVVSPVASTANALAGRLPGLISIQSSGQPGADAATLSIRGFGAALIIVDGVETAFNNIDPNQIESISILKDGAASIYGSRAGNGVILVTTKRGVIGKPSFTINTTLTGQALTAFPHLMSSGDIAELSRETWINAGKPVDTAPFTLDEIQKYYNGTDPQYPNTDWRKILIRDIAPQQQHNISVRGGSDKIKYFGFLSYLDQESMWKSGKGGDFQRYNLQSNIDARITDNLSLRLDIAATNEYRKYPWRSQKLALWQDFFQTSPMYPATLPDPTKLSYAQGGGTGSALFMTNSDIAGYDNTDNTTLNTTLSLDYSVKQVNGLSLKAFVNVLQYSSFEKFFEKPLTFWTYDIASKIYSVAGSLNSQAFLNETYTRNRNITSQFSANYDHTFARDHHITAMALYEAIGYTDDLLTGGRRNFITPAIDQLYMGTVQSSTVNGSADEMGRKSLVTRLSYIYKNKYLLESIFRTDASAKFPANKRWGYFPSVSLGWRVSEEGFIKKNFNSIDNLKLRASYGKSGNDGVGNFQYLSGYTTGNAVMIGGNQVAGMVSTGLANPDLTWERIKIYNIGTDFSFFNRKLFGEIDAFYRERNGIPATKITSLPVTFGATQPPENLNSMNTRGFEVQLGTSGKINDFNYDISGNLSWARSKWEHYEEPVYTDPDQKRIFQISGKWTDYTYGYKTKGLFTSQAQIDALGYDMDGQGNQSLKPGDLIFLDTNGDGKVDWKDQVGIGKGTTPEWMLGLNTNLKYKNFDLSALFQGAFGYYNFISPGIGGVQPKWMFDWRWTPENDNANAFIPRPGSTSSAGGSVNDHYYEKAGYLRLKTFSIGYNLPSYLLQHIKFSRLRIYAAGTNLYTFNKLKRFNIDPEVPSGNTGQSYPQQLTITLGINASF